MSFWRRLRYGYEQDRDERARQIERRSYSEALAITFLLALALPLVAQLPGVPALMRVLWPLLPAATILAVIFIAQGIRVLRGGVTRRVALVGLGTIVIYALVIELASWLISSFVH